MKRRTLFMQELLGRAPRKNSLRQKSGFTMIELIIVIAIMSMLAGLLLPALNKARQRARVANCSTTIGSLRTALAMYSLDYGLYPPSATSTTQYNGNCSLSALSGSPNNLVNALQATAKSGPYMEFKGKDLDETTSTRPVLLDPWGQAYIYVCQKDVDRDNVASNRGPLHPNATTDKNYNTYNIYSLGPDRQTYGGDGHDDTDDWNDVDLIDNNGGVAGLEDLDGDWNSTTDQDDPRYDDINSWDGARG